MPLFFMWLATYSNNLDVMDAFYVYAYVNTWYYASLFWIVQLFWVIAIGERNSGMEILPDTYKDHSLSIFIVQMVMAITAIVFQTVWADRFNFWYVKMQFLNGRSVNESKNNVWSYPSAIGSTGRSQYNYTNPNREARTPVEKTVDEQRDNADSIF
jgi:hypothetical protein